ncbi:speckle-type POZ protein B-like [Paramacrobiotus metropolitanus]|uniref:speckle-type POZ protein B-like n=1 Tax=Paramacrobiotus metropolitanus TaxID=2943436 RepID=UPI00244620C0|nr:speckle-type POZ protein B-like [Paramacrobiotus metropolitanus]
MLKRNDWNIDLMFHTTTVNEATTRSHTSFCSNLANMRTAEVLTDCTLLTNDGKEFPAYRIVLAAQSDVFSAMFQHDTLEKKTGRCEIKDINSDTLGIVLDFVYQCLRDLCEKAMAASLTVENALDMLVFAKNRQLVFLKTKAACR